MLDRPLEDANRYEDGCEDAVNEDQAKEFLSVIDEGLELYLRRYLFLLRERREPADGEPLPVLE